MPSRYGSLLSHVLANHKLEKTCELGVENEHPMDRIEASANTPVFEESDKEDLVTLPISPLPIRRSRRETIVQKGFGAFLVQDNTTTSPRRSSCSYPPMSNAAYDLTMSDNSQNDSPYWHSNFDGIAWVKQHLLDQASMDEQIREQAINESPGALAAREINWGRQTFDDEDLIFAFDEPHISIPYEVERFSSAIDNATVQGQHMFDYCTVCQEWHIPWGPPITLQDRDTCYSMLPEWFPAHLFKRPWDAFIELINDLVKFDEIKQGRRRNPFARVRFDKEYHEPSRAWSAIGRGEGWWKCRSGPEFSEAERTCTLCHGNKLAEVAKREDKRRSVEKGHDKVLKWLQKHVEEGGKKDRATVAAKMWGEIHD
ncbi:MAG: hypothetical protein M1818_006265 [Claussenomyces sp. TS43310]|nr:MAG: hypothetical protein M1818_006265 [Claussenomyces sp. TS43310]